MIDYQAEVTIPCNQEAEEAVVGSIMINPECYSEVSQVLQARDFYILRNGWIFESFGTLTVHNAPIDVLTVANELQQQGRLSEVGGAAFLTVLANRVPSSLNAVSYARMVREQAERRQALRLASEVAQKAYDQSQPFDVNEQAVQFIQAGRGQSRRVSTSEATSEMIDLMNCPRFFTTGIADIDSKIGGLFPEELSILAGYQGTGKSSAKIQGARKNAEAGRKILLVDTEMSAAQTWFRMACGDLEIDVNSVRSNKVDSETKGSIIHHAAQLGEQYKNNIVIYQSPMTPADILSAAILEQPDLIYVDTLKNVSGKPPNESKAEWYDSVLSFLRVRVAQALKCHVQVLHHITRSTFKESRKPTMHDLMFAGESDPDAVFLLHRKQDNYENVNPKNPVTPITWIIDKSRFGWTGEEEVNFKLTSQEFYGMEKYRGYSR